MRAQIRLAFEQWGLPSQLRVDNGAPWGSWGDWPTALALWVIGLGSAMHWNHARRPTENAVVERSQGTSSRWCEPQTCATPEELQTRLVRWDRFQREVYLYRERQSRMAFYPGLSHSGRPYDRDSEPRLWEWSRVAEHLSGYTVVRRVDRSGLVSLYDKGHYVGKMYHGKDVFVSYDPVRNEWVIAAHDGRQIRRLPADQITPERVMNLNVRHHT